MSDLEQKLRALHDAKHPVPVCPFCTYGMPCQWLEEYRQAAALGATVRQARIVEWLRNPESSLPVKPGPTWRVSVAEFLHALADAIEAGAHLKEQP